MKSRWRAPAYSIIPIKWRRWHHHHHWKWHRLARQQKRPAIIFPNSIGTGCSSIVIRRRRQPACYLYLYIAHLCPHHLSSIDGAARSGIEGSNGENKMSATSCRCFIGSTRGINLEISHALSCHRLAWQSSKAGGGRASKVWRWYSLLKLLFKMLLRAGPPARGNTGARRKSRQCRMNAVKWRYVKLEGIEVIAANRRRDNDGKRGENQKVAAAQAK